MEIIQRQLRFGEYSIAASGNELGQAPYVLGGQQLYAIGHGSGELGPIGVEHLVGEMGGIWAHPCKVAAGIEIALLDSHGAPLAAADVVFTERLDEVCWSWKSAELGIVRRDHVPSLAPAYRVLIEIENRGERPVEAALQVVLPIEFIGAWFSGIACDGGTCWQSGNLLLGQDGIQSGWGVAFGAELPPDSCTITPKQRGTIACLVYRFQVGPHTTRSWPLLLAVGQNGGASEATERWQELIDGTRLFAISDSEAARQENMPRLECADPELSRDLALAQANLALLRADYPATGAYFLAGLPEYPQLFGCDTTYSVPGAVAGGFAPTARAALETLVRYAERACGRVPHEITTNGRVFNPGNVQETPQLTIAVWDYLRWSGDLAFAERIFPVCREGLLALVPSLCGPSGPYPYGDGMVERMGMGSRKLDSACYTIAGLRALANIAAAIGASEAAEYLARSEELHAAFERDWWLESEGLYADSMHSDGRLQLDGHWTVVLPVQLGLAAPARAKRVLARIEAEWVNEWGLVHTRAQDERVWTLPTGLLALAAFANGHAEQGLRLASNIAITARHGTLGAFKELIPAGLCFVQLWSAAIYIQAIFEGLLGLQPNAPAHQLVIAPCLPTSLPEVTIRELRVGEHGISLKISPRALHLAHLRGPQPLTVIYAGATHVVAPGQQLEQAQERREEG